MCAYFSGDPELNFLNPESQKIFRDLIENIKTGIFMADSRDSLFYVNHAFNEIFEFPNHTHATGKNWQQVIFPDSSARTEFLNRLKFQGLDYVKDFETTRVNAYGQRIALIVTVNYIYNEKGNVIGVRGVVIDITERRKLEEQLQGRQQKLEEILNFYNKLGDFMALDELYAYIVKQTTGILEAKRCSIMDIDFSSDEGNPILAKRRYEKHGYHKDDTRCGWFYLF